MGILLMMFFGSTLGDELRRWFLENRKMMGIAVVVIDMSIKEMYSFFFFSFPCCKLKLPVIVNNPPFFCSLVGREIWKE